jgi:1-acyl-sn-glycerol-3-phosphate acyltransferase
MLSAKLFLALRLMRVGLHLLSGLLQCGLLFPWLKQPARNLRIGCWARQLLRIFRIQLQVEGELRGTGAVVANHVSWIDVFVLDAVQPCRFVAKSEVRRWPVIGLLSARAGTLYLDRQSRFGLRASNLALARCLLAGESIAFFPEGTSSPQGAMLPFHANLFAGVVQASAPVLPVALSYLDQDGNSSNAADYIGEMSLGQSIVRLLTDGPLIARLQWLTPLASLGRDRRGLAAEAHTCIASALGQAAPLLLEREQS